MNPVGAFNTEDDRKREYDLSVGTVRSVARGIPSNLYEFKIISTICALATWPGLCWAREKDRVGGIGRGD